MKIRSERGWSSDGRNKFKKFFFSISLKNRK